MIICYREYLITYSNVELKPPVAVTLRVFKVIKVAFSFDISSITIQGVSLWMKLSMTIARKWTSRTLQKALRLATGENFQNS